MVIGRYLLRDLQRRPLYPDPKGGPRCPHENVAGAQPCLMPIWTGGWARLPGARPGWNLSGATAMKRWTAAIGTMIGLGLLAAPAMAADSGRVSLQPGEAKQIYIGSTARELRICNDSTSGGEL